MEIQFRLAWARGGLNQAFKLAGSRMLFFEYVNRISKFTPCETRGALSKSEIEKSGTKIWVCDRGAGSKQFSSEALADLLEKSLDSGTHRLLITLGGPDGFSKNELEALRPDLKWSFGPLTLPHELAAVVAGEQIYRAWTILRRMPYHSRH